MVKKIGFIIFAILCVAIGVYPSIYVILEGTFGLLKSKSDVLLNDTFWKIGFYTHIFLGGLALLIGWMQFSQKFRTKNIKRHRTIGKIYTICVLFSGLASLFIACFATGGVITMLGFMGLGIVWLYSTTIGYMSIKKGNVKRHHKFMIYSYAACFAAVTLRLWLPALTTIFQDFIIAYKIVAWICWVPNVIVAYVIVKRLGLNKV